MHTGCSPSYMYSHKTIFKQPQRFTHFTWYYLNDQRQLGGETLDPSHLRLAVLDGSIIPEHSQVMKYKLLLAPSTTTFVVFVLSVPHAEGLYD